VGGHVNQNLSQAGSSAQHAQSASLTLQNNRFLSPVDTPGIQVACGIKAPASRKNDDALASGFRLTFFVFGIESPATGHQLGQWCETSLGTGSLVSRHAWPLSKQIIATGNDTLETTILKPYPTIATLNSQIQTLDKTAESPTPRFHYLPNSFEIRNKKQRQRMIANVPA